MCKVETFLLNMKWKQVFQTEHKKLTSDLARVVAIQGICLPMAIALDDEDLVSLEIQGGFSLLVTVLFIVAVIFGLWLLEKALRYICKYYKMNNLNSIWIKKHIYVKL